MKTLKKTQVKKGSQRKFHEELRKNKFEFTSPGTPHQNGVVEQVFASLYSRMRLMITHAGLHENIKTGIWPKCAATVTKLENIMVNTHI